MSRSQLRASLAKARVLVRIKGPRILIRKGISTPTRLVRARRSYSQLASRYPMDLVFIAALPKSGSSWIASMLASLPGFETRTPTLWTAVKLTTESHDLPAGIFDEYAKRLVVVKGHTRATVSNTQFLERSGNPYIVTVRDPRDQIISDYWYVKARPHHARYSEVANTGLAEFIDRRLNDGSFDTQVLDWIRMWWQNASSELVHFVKYEEMLTNTGAEVEAMFLHLGIQTTSREVDEIIAANTFEKVTGRPPGHEDKAAFARKAQPGEWRTAFSASQKRQFHRIGEDVIELGGWAPTR